MQKRFLSLPLLVLSVSLQGCAGTDGTSVTSLTQASPPPNTGAVKPAVELLMGPMPVGSPTEIYTRVGRGILKCWFGSDGPLKQNYKFYADAEPPSKGGASVISIQTKETTSLEPGSIRAWRVGIVPSPDGTSLQIENYKLDPVFAQQLETDVRRWGAGEEDCSTRPLQASPVQPVLVSKPKSSTPQSSPAKSSKATSSKPQSSKAKSSKAKSSKPKSSNVKSSNAKSSTATSSVSKTSEVTSSKPEITAKTSGKTPHPVSN